MFFIFGLVYCWQMSVYVLKQLLDVIFISLLKAYGILVAVCNLHDSYPSMLYCASAGAWLGCPFDLHDPMFMCNLCVVCFYTDRLCLKAFLWTYHLQHSSWVNWNKSKIGNTLIIVLLGYSTSLIQFCALIFYLDERWLL